LGTAGLDDTNRWSASIEDKIALAANDGLRRRGDSFS